MQQKRIAAIHDLSGVGKCSLTVALPIVSTAGIECCVIPTALLSTHTGGFRDPHIRDLTDSILPVAEHWKREGFYFNAIYSGYLGSMRQIEILVKCMELLRQKDTLVVIDPVMGDNGRLYQTFGSDFPYKMRELCAKADIITPNITEACLMLGDRYQPPPYTREYIRSLLLRLSDICGGCVVLTGVSLSKHEQGAAAYSKAEQKSYFASSHRIEGMYHGTGDIFASVFVSSMVLGRGVERSLQTAVDFTCRAIENSAADHHGAWYGVNFEGVLPELGEMLKR